MYLPKTPDFEFTDFLSFLNYNVVCNFNFTNFVYLFNDYDLNFSCVLLLGFLSFDIVHWVVKFLALNGGLKGCVTSSNNYGALPILHY
jgi:hypothetical protein